MSEEIVFVRRASGLVRELDWYDVFLWSLAAPAASGMTYYAVKMLGDPSYYGGSPILAFFIAGLMFLPLVIAFALIASSFPRSTSLYVFTSRVLHPLLGYLPFWYYIIGGGSAMASGLILYIGVKALSGPLYIAGVITGNRALMKIGSDMSNPVHQLWISIIFIVIVWIINIFGMKVVKWFMRIATVFPLAITIIALVGLATLGPSGGLSRFNTLFGSGVAEKIMDIGLGRISPGAEKFQPLTSAGFLAGTYGMLLYAIWAWTGLEVATFVGSEVKNPSRSYLRGYVLGYLAVMILYLANAFIVPWSFNYDFIASYVYLQKNYPDILSNVLGGLTPPEASVPFFASIAFGNAVIAIVIGIAFLLWYFNTVVPIWVSGVRGFFSMAFDRVLPEKLADVSPRFAAPTWANHITAILALIGASMTYLEDLGITLAGAVISFFDFSVLLFIWPVGLALMVAPWWRPDLFKQMVFPSKVLSTIVGAIVFALGWWFMLYTSYSDPLIQLVNIVVGVIGILVFVYTSARNRARGIDPTKIYSQIPPA